MKRHSSSAKFKHMRREYHLTVLMNEQEWKALNKYCARYNVRNRSQFVRETLVKKIMRRFDDDAPTLFDQI